MQLDRMSERVGGEMNRTRWTIGVRVNGSVWTILTLAIRSRAHPRCTGTSSRLVARLCRRHFNLVRTWTDVINKADVRSLSRGLSVDFSSHIALVCCPHACSQIN